jgi:hypothetical protein
MANEPVSVIPDPFADDLFGGIDTREDGGSFEDELQKIADEGSEVDASAAPAPVEPVKPAPKVDEPQIYQYDDGSSVTIEHGTKGWKATLESNTGAKPEVFYGSTKDELLLNLAAGKMNATQKIRELNKRTKLGIDGSGDPVAPVAPAPAPQSGNLTADDIFALKTKLQDDPDAAFEEYFLKKTGLTIGQLAQLAKTGKAASDELSAEAISKEFLSRHPDYVPYEDNFKSLIAWLCKHKLGQSLNGRDPNALVEVLYNAGKFTGENLDEAYDDLVDDGLLDLQVEEPVVPAEPVAPAAPVAVAPVAPVPPANDRIVREFRRPRAGLGIRTRETIGSIPAVEDATKSPSADELDNLSDAELGALLQGVRKQRLGTLR